MRKKTREEKDIIARVAGDIPHGYGSFALGPFAIVVERSGVQRVLIQGSGTKLSDAIAGIERELQEQKNDK